MFNFLLKTNQHFVKTNKFILSLIIMYFILQGFFIYVNFEFLHMHSLVVVKSLSNMPMDESYMKVLGFI
jgi:hypothetical protein